MSALHTQIADELAAHSWCVVDHYFAPELLEALQHRLNLLEAEQALNRAGVGRADAHTTEDAIRTDLTHWLELDQDETEARFLATMETLRLALNEKLMLGLFEYEAHFALYPAGAFYKRHVDAFRGEKNRIISTVLYLNPNWQEGDGGELALYREMEEVPFHMVEPRFGRLVVFLSEDIPHEVLESHAPRRSIAGWFRGKPKL